MLAIWKAQEIDLALRKAYDKGTILAGGSAGSLCWFNGGTTDSRPKELSTAVKAVSIGEDNYSYYVYKKDGKIIEEKMESEKIL